MPVYSQSHILLIISRYMRICTVCNIRYGIKFILHYKMKFIGVRCYTTSLVINKDKDKKISIQNINLHMYKQNHAL